MTNFSSARPANLTFDLLLGVVAVVVGTREMGRPIRDAEFYLSGGRREFAALSGRSRRAIGR